MASHPSARLAGSTVKTQGRGEKKLIPLLERSNEKTILKSSRGKEKEKVLKNTVDVTCS